MKFAEHLSAHITPEWRKQYIQYEEMKTMLYAALEEAPSAEIVEPEVLQRYFANFDEKFFHFCDKGDDHSQFCCTKIVSTSEGILIKTKIYKFLHVTQS